MAKAVKLLSILPFEIQTIIGDGVTKLADREFEVKKLLKALRSIGTDKVMALHKSKQRKRVYDHNPALHNAMNHMFVLSDENQDYMAEQIIELLGYILDYLKTCKVFDVAPVDQDVIGLVNTFVKSGSEEAKIFLEKLKARVEAMVSNVKLERADDAQRLNRILDGDRQGMRIKDQ